MRNLPFIALLLVTGVCSAQLKVDVYFLKNNGKYVTIRDSADYVRTVSEPDSGSTLYNVVDYYLNGKRKSIGKSSRMYPLVYQDKRITYYSKGARQKIFNYKNGELIGEEYQFYPNGKPYLTIKHPIGTIPESDFDNDLIMACYDSTGVALATDGNGSYMIYDDLFKNVIESGEVKNGKRDGECNGIDVDGFGKYIEKYDTGKLISGVLTESSGKTISYSGSRGTPPTYKGGLTAFYKYLGKKIKYPEFESNHNIRGTVTMTFVVETDGRVTDIKVINTVSPGIDKEALRVMSASPLWIPGVRFGRPVRVEYFIPIDFDLQEVR